MAGKKLQSAKKKKMINNTIVHIVLAVLAIIWLFPIAWVILTSFRAEKGSYVSTFFPKAFTLDIYSADIFYGSVARFHFCKGNLQSKLRPVYDCNWTLENVGKRIY